jgi:hypothetical protein
MLDLQLEPTDNRAHPIFKDKASCEAWLQQLQLTNLHQAHGMLRAQLDEFNRYPMQERERLRTLEFLRENLALVQGDYAKKLVSKKLPFSNDELTVFVAIIALWKGLLTGYQRCLQAYIAGDKQLADSGALLTQRCLRYSGLQIFEYLRNGYEFDAKLWQQLHALFAFAEDNNFQRQAVADEVHSPNHPSSCQAVWVKTLLASHAHPAELARGQLQILDRWLTLWSDVIEVDRHFKISEQDAPPLAVDLWGKQGLQSLKFVSPSGEMRYLAMVPLSKQLRVKTILLQQGQSPLQLELGDCNSAEAAEFLKTVHRYLCEPSTDRQIDRRSATLPAKLCFNIEDIYAQIALKPFRQQKQVSSDKLAQTQIAAFGRVLTDSDFQHGMQPAGAPEQCLIENESILGAKVLRVNNQGERIGVHQIVALRPSDANAFMIGRVSWIMVTLSGQLRMGIQYFPGVAQAISIKKSSEGKAASDKAVAALLLPAVPTLKTPASLIVPRDFFQAGQLADITELDDKHQAIKMGFSVVKGIDFERISFSPA